jgi:23S rRNA (cytosine1962-C5)-methyltransferase
MIESRDYQLLDVGAGKKLEQFASVMVQRPCPAALGLEPDNKHWQPDAIFDDSNSGNQGWTFAKGNIEDWQIDFRGLTLQLKPTPFGHVGLFPEHAMHWNWLTESVGLAEKNILHLFAYTGATSLELARRGARVAHVDASKSAVKWASTNAGLSGLSDKPVRWIVEDALKFVKREAARGRQYDGFIADPPSYGHGPKGENWNIQSDLKRLLSALRQLVGTDPAVMVLTSHSPGFENDVLQSELATAFAMAKRDIQSGPMNLVSKSGGKLQSGWFARYTSPA